MTRKIAALLIASILACQGEAPAASANGRDTAAADAAASAAGAGTRGGAATASAAATERRPAILFLGTSLTAGYGVGADAAFPALIQQRLDSAGLPYRVVNAGLSGETSAGGLRRLDWSLQDSLAVLVLELGANDGLRGLPTAQMRANLDSILGRTRARYPNVRIVIVGMEAPPNLGPRYTAAFRDVFEELAAAHDAALVPFLLEGVAGEPSLNQHDAIHPNVAGHRIIAATVWPVLKSVLEE
jgi:acyl-CoA thioesterase-1